MSRDKELRTQIMLPCVIRLSEASEVIAHGVTELLSRDFIVAMVAPVSSSVTLRTHSTVLVTVDLPSTGLFTQRVLECTSRITRISLVDHGMHIGAHVTGMEFRERDAEAVGRRCSHKRPVASEQITAAFQPQMFNHMILRNHSTNLHTGDNTMNFLKNLFIEEDGQDMVEYGLVIALVVLAAVSILSGFKTNIGTAFTALGSDVTTNVK